MPPVSCPNGIAHGPSLDRALKSLNSRLAVPSLKLRIDEWLHILLRHLHHQLQANQEEYQLYAPWQSDEAQLHALVLTLTEEIREHHSEHTHHPPRAGIEEWHQVVEAKIRAYLLIHIAQLA